ncbi:hypothetical protein FOL75_04895 [Bacillus thuringiensis]|uniref:hypothetical protein n=1 Tax=Bacillus thuringiensis TaxID=1428 RepID=UPI002853F29B|nr:hypothetical protein [Bacillus thuringiensis]MDR5021406.1 hypothetical protein [Bacillus thuringiensis]
MCLKNGLEIDFFPINNLGNGLIEIVEIKPNGERKLYPYHLCNTKDSQQFIRDVRENRRSFLIGEETGSRTFELFVDEEGFATFRYPEWNTIREMQTRLLSVHNKIKFRVTSKEKLKKMVETYVKEEFSSLYQTQGDLSENVLNNYFTDLYQEANIYDDTYNFFTLEEWLQMNRFSVDSLEKGKA